MFNDFDHPSPYGLLLHEWGGEALPFTGFEEVSLMFYTYTRVFSMISITLVPMDVCYMNVDRCIFNEIGPRTTARSPRAPLDSFNE